MKDSVCRSAHPCYRYSHPLIQGGDNKGAMQDMKLTSVAAASIAAAIAPVSFGQAVATPAPSAPSIVRQEMQWYFTEGVEIYTFKGDGENLIGLKQNLGLDLGNGLNLKFVAPIYSQGDSMSFGDLNLGASLDVASGKNNLIGNWDLAVGGGVYIPTGVDQFRSQTVNPYINAAFDCDIWVFDFKQTAEFAFNGGETFLPLLGTKVDTDVLTFGSDLTYKWGSFDVGLALDQYYYVTNGEKQLFLGPTAKWDIASNLTLNLGVGIPVYQDVSTPESNAVVTAGFGIKF